MKEAGVLRRKGCHFSVDLDFSSADVGRGRMAPATAASTLRRVAMTQKPPPFAHQEREKNNNNNRPRPESPTPGRLSRLLLLSRAT